MGGCMCCDLAQRGTVMPHEFAGSKDIEEQNFKDLEEEKKIIKCLLLGAGECGKSTILKQMKILHDNGFNDAELRSFIPLIRKNALESIQTLCNLTIDILRLPFSSEENKARAQRFVALGNLTGSESAIPALKQNPDEWVMDILALWKGDEGIAKAFQAARAHDLGLPDSAEYFLNHTERVWHSSYLPNDQDVLRARSTTVGIQQMDFAFERRKYRMYDVGGQRGDRKKWIHYFSGVSVVLWVASLSEYNQHLTEDNTKNRLVESVKLFAALSDLPWFRDKPMILFLNKADIFRTKIESIDLGIFFPKYTGRKAHFQDGVEFIKELFIDRTRGGGHGGAAAITAAGLGAPSSPTHGHLATASAAGSLAAPHATYAPSKPGAAASASATGAAPDKNHLAVDNGLLNVSVGGAMGSARSTAATSRSAVHPHTLGGLAMSRTQNSGAGSARGGGSSSHGHHRSKVIYTHVTDATHTDTIGLVWRSSITHILEEHLKHTNGFLS